MPSPTAVFGLGAGFVLLLALAELARRRWHASPETSRKIVHIGGGLLTLPLPWLVESPRAVFLLAAVCSLALFAGRLLHLLAGVHGVARRTGGSEFFPLSIALLFVVSEGQPWLFVSSMLVLAVADAFAALVGTRFGRLRYRVEDDEKSLEGSLAFLAVAWPAMVLPMLLWTDLAPSTVLLSSLLVALLVTGFEVISLHGTDNLFVPLGVCVVLAKITTKPMAEIVYQTASFALLLGGGGILAWRTRTFNVGGGLTMLLFCYGAWSLASEAWAVPPLTGFVAYALGRRLLPVPAERDTPVRVRVVFRALIIPLLVLVVANMHHRMLPMAGTYSAAIGVAALQSFWNHWRLRAKDAAPWREFLYALLALAAVSVALQWPAGASWFRAALLAAVWLANEVRRRVDLRAVLPWDAYQLSLAALATAAELTFAGGSPT